MALTSIQILALRADDVASATQAATLLGNEFRSSLAYQSICDYYFRRGEIAQARAAAAKITDEGDKKRANNRFILQQIIDQQGGEKELVAAAEREGLSREDVSHAIGDFIDRETSAGHLDRAEALLRQVNFAPFEFGNGLSRIGLEATRRNDQPRYRRLIAEAQTMVPKCDPGFGPLLQGFIRTCRIESGEAAAVVEEIRADKQSAEDLGKIKIIDPILLRALVWAGRPDEAIAAVKPGTDLMLFTPGGLPPTSI